jgi:hypothetical protein
MLGVMCEEAKVWTVKMKTMMLVGNGSWNLTCFVY